MLCCNNQPINTTSEINEPPPEDLRKAESRKGLNVDVHKMADRIDRMKSYETETLKNNSELGKILKAINEYLQAFSNENRCSSGDFCKFLQGELEFSLLPKKFLEANKELGLDKVPPYVNGILKEAMNYRAPWFDSSIDHEKNINKIEYLAQYCNESNSECIQVNKEGSIEPKVRFQEEIIAPSYIDGEEPKNENAILRFNCIQVNKEGSIEPKVRFQEEIIAPSYIDGEEPKNENAILRFNVDKLKNRNGDVDKEEDSSLSFDDDVWAKELRNTALDAEKKWLG